MIYVLLALVLSGSALGLAWDSGAALFLGGPERISLGNGRSALFIGQNREAPVVIFLHAATGSARDAFILLAPANFSAWLSGQGGAELLAPGQLSP